MKKSLYLLISLLILTEAAAVNVYAGEWKREPRGWRWENDDGSSPANGWEWLDGNGDRVYEYYYFDEDGYMMADVDVSDGSCLNHDGAWEVEGEVQTKRVAADVMDEAEVERQIIILVNQERKKYGLSELTVHEELKGNAGVRARELDRKFDHTRPDGESFDTAVTVNHTQAGENIIYTNAFSQTTEEEVARTSVECWLGSEAHRKNILAPQWKQTAIAVYMEGDMIYAVQLFIDQK
jgi:Uncharacterized protein with SCP/PR1 domains